MKSLHILCLLGGAPMALAQIQVSPGYSYTQDFDSLANTGTAQVPWSDNSTLPGWYAYRNPSAITSYGPSAGPSDGLSSFGINGATDRALGTGLDLTTGSYIHFGTRFTNASLTSINNFSVSYDGEQWRRAGNLSGGSDSLVFSYRIFDAGTGSLSAVSGWTSIDSLTFTSPVNSGETSQLLDGNLAANRVAGIYGSITGISLASGQELWIRWTATNLAQFSDHSLGIDNVSVTFGAIPEPASFAALLGASLAIMGVLRRPTRKRA